MTKTIWNNMFNVFYYDSAVKGYLKNELIIARNEAEAKKLVLGLRGDVVISKVTRASVS